MSNQAATEFLARLAHDETLREQVREAEKGRSEKASVLVEVGSGYGYDFSADELHHVLCALHQHKIGELSEEELVEVAGSLIDMPDWLPDHG
jgi:predicted ribosomally synthesized peptide with nif11-like leader